MTCTLVKVMNVATGNFLILGLATQQTKIIYFLRYCIHHKFTGVTELLEGSVQCPQVSQLLYSLFYLNYSRFPQRKTVLYELMALYRMTLKMAIMVLICQFLPFFFC